MPYFVRLVRLTAAGAKNTKNFGKMVDSSKKIFASNGVRLVDAYATFGKYDVVAVVDAPNEAAMARVGAAVAAQGYFAVQTMAAMKLDAFTRTVSGKAPAKKKRG